MDNASRAITIAAGILIGIMLISIAMYSATVFRDFFSGVANSKQTQAIVEFNRFFTESMFNNGELYGYDAYNIIQKANEINNDPDAPTFIDNIGTVQVISYSDNSGDSIGDYSELEKIYTYSYQIDDKTGYVSSIKIDIKT